MSVREKPVSSRYLDLLEKERCYRRHVKKVAHSRATINTSQPETPRRLMVAERNNTRYRNGMRRTFVERDIMVASVERPRTTTFGARSTRSSNMFSPQSSVHDDVDLFSRDIMTPQPGRKRATTVDRVREPSSPQTPQARARKVDAVRIGYGPRPIIESQEIEDDSPVEAVDSQESGAARYDEDAVAVPCDDGFDGEPGMFVT